MKKLLIGFLAFLFCACAGNPPAWWNPSGAYGPSVEVAPTQKTVVQPSLSATVTSEEEEPMEQTFEPAIDEPYEEMRLSPLPETDETEPTQGTTAPSSAEEAEELDLGGKKTSAKTTTSNPKAPIDEGALPMPSVLE